MDKIEALIINLLKELTMRMTMKILLMQIPNTKLFAGANFDSMGLVIFISDLEEIIDEEFGKNLTLADDRAMSSKILQL